MSLLLVALACTGSTPLPEPAPAPAEPVKSEVQEHMADHFAAGTIAFDAFLQGEIDSSRERLTWLAEHPAPAGLPEGSEGELARLHAVAKEAAIAPRFDQVAQGLGEVGAACGGCHAAHGAHPAIELGEAPPASTELLPHMARHQWAVKALWAGLVIPSDDAWRRGAEALGGSPLPEGAFDVPQVSKESWAAAEKAHARATAARDLATPEERGEAFGQVIAACAQCHTEMRGE